MKIKELLKKLGWTAYRMKKEAGLNSGTAHRIATEERGETSTVKLTKKWLNAEIKIKEFENE